MEDSQVVAALSIQLAERIGMERYSTLVRAADAAVRGGRVPDDPGGERFRARLAAEELRRRHSGLLGKRRSAGRCRSNSRWTESWPIPAKSAAANCAEEFHCGSGRGEAAHERRQSRAEHAGQRGSRRARGVCRRTEQRVRVSCGRTDRPRPAAGLADVVLRADGRRQDAPVAGRRARVSPPSPACRRRVSHGRAVHDGLRGSDPRQRVCRASARSAAVRGCW